MVGAGDLQRRHQSFGAELLDALGGDVEVLDAPAHLLAGQRLAAELALGDADRLDRQDAGDETPVVVDRPHALRADGTLAHTVDLVEDLLDDREIRARGVEARGNVADRRLAGGNDVLFGAAPPHADDPIGREADAGRFLERGRVHHPPAAKDDPVGLVAARDLQPGRLLVEPRVRDRVVPDLEAVHLGLLVEDRDRLLAVARLMVEVGDLLALQVLHAPLLHAHELDLRGVLAPVVGHEREHVGEDLAVGRVGTPVAHRDDRNLVDGRALDEAVGDAGAQGVDHASAGRTLALQALVALDAAVGVVAELALFPGDRHAVDAAVGVHERQVVEESAGDSGAARGIRSHAVDRVRDELLVLGLNGRHGRSQHARGRQGEQDCSEFHALLLHGGVAAFRKATGILTPGPMPRTALPGRRPWPTELRQDHPSYPGTLGSDHRHCGHVRLSRGTATAAVFPSRSARAERSREAPRSGRR